MNKQLCFLCDSDEWDDDQDEETYCESCIEEIYSGKAGNRNEAWD